MLGALIKAQIQTQFIRIVFGISGAAFFISVKIVQLNIAMKFLFSAIILVFCCSTLCASYKYLRLKRATNSACAQPRDQGPCLAYFERYYYNQTSNSCEMFVYGGCDGNDNNFDTEEECRQACVDAGEDDDENPSIIGSILDILT